MPIIAKGSNGSGGDFQPCPQGVHQGVCVDVIDMGLLKVTWGGVEKKQHKIRVVWQVAERMDNGKPFIVQKRYTLSLYEKSNLRQDLESWRGRAFTNDETDGFDVEKLIGANAMLNVIHVTKGDHTYANVKAIMPLMKGVPKIDGESYTRHVDRDPQAPPVNDDGPQDTAPELDDIPFAWLMPLIVPALAIGGLWI